jgi:hypothetical protein
MVVAIASSPEAEGSGGGSTPATPFLPPLELPTIAFTQHVGSLDTIAPSEPSSSSSLSLRGSFTAASLNNPDYNAQGLNWVHWVDRNWISSTQWSYTERMVLVFNLSNSETTTEETLPTDPLPEGQVDDDDLDETSSYTSTLSATRRGFISFTFTSSQGISTPSAAGVQWSISVGYSDTLSVQAAASGTATFTPTAGTNENDYPDDFTANSSWSGTISATAFNSGSMSVSSTPSIATDNVIDRNISASVSYSAGGNATGTEEWSAGSQSGSIVLLDHPSAPGNPLVCTTGDAAYAPIQFPPIDPNEETPFDPIGRVAGNGHASLAGGSGTGTMSGALNGSMNLQGTMRNGKWSSLMGGAMSALDGAKANSGGAGGLFVYNDDSVTPIPFGTVTSKVLLKAGWGGNGNGSGSADGDGNVSISASAEGDMLTDDSGSNGSVQGNGNDSGDDFMYIDASMVKVSDWDVENEPYPNLPGAYTRFNHGHDNSNAMLTYRSRSRGMSLGALASLAAGNQPSNSNINANLNGSGFETLKITSDEDFYLYRSVYEGPGTDLDEFWDTTGNQLEEYRTDYTIGGTLTGALQPDDSVSWTIAATAEVDQSVDYQMHDESESWEFDYALTTPAYDMMYDHVRDANFEANESFTGSLSGSGVAGTGFHSANVSIDEVFSSIGDEQVEISGHNMYGQAWEKSELELALESMFGADELPEDDGYESSARGSLGDGTIWYGQPGSNQDGNANTAPQKSNSLWNSFLSWWTAPVTEPVNVGENVTLEQARTNMFTGRILQEDVRAARQKAAESQQEAATRSAQFVEAGMDITSAGSVLRLSTGAHVDGTPTTNGEAFSDSVGLAAQWGAFFIGPVAKMVDRADNAPKGVANFTKEMLNGSEVIAKGSSIRKIDDLVEKFGGTKKGWTKKKGWDANGQEWHWYEHHGIGRVGIKLPGVPDPF